ncbi:hypothetical protein ACHAWF_018969 [Thalassiosira exigua]
MLTSPSLALLAVLGAASAAGGRSHRRAVRAPASAAAFSSGFSSAPSIARRPRRPFGPARPESRLEMAPPPGKERGTVAEIEAESEKLRKEIEELREEALRRLEELTERMSEASIPATGASSSSSSTSTADGSSTSIAQEEGLLPAPAPIAIRETSSPKKKTWDVANLLDGTRWKVSLSIGREPGTWMPNDWGASGQRINLSFVAEFASSQLFDRDDFLRGGYADAKVLHVVDNEITLGPSVSEGRRTYKAKDGGWRVSRGDGPMGTDLLRFFVEVDEEISHAGEDVYLPRGRVYSSCGYFPFLGGGADAPSAKEAYTKEMEGIEEEMRKLQQKKDEIRNPFNLEGIRMSREMFKLRKDAERVADKLNFMAVTDPDKSLLRFSKEGDVALTKEGGVCCQVNKGPVVEYHILGRFGIASDEHRA